MRRKVTQQESIYMLNLLFTGWQFLENLDKVQETTMFRQGLKQKVNLLMPELEKFVDGMGDLFGVDSAGMNNLMEHKRQLFSKLIPMRPERHSALNVLLDKYFENPEAVIEKLDIKIVKTANQ